MPQSVYSTTSTPSDKDDGVGQQPDHEATLRSLRKTKLGKGQTPAARDDEHAVKQAKVDQLEAKNAVAIAGTLTAIVDQIDFQRCPLLPDELRGAMLLILDGAKQPAMVARYRDRDNQHLASKRRPSGGFTGFVVAAKPGAEMMQAAKALKLSYKGLHGGFAGRAEVADFVALGRDYSCSVRITLGKDDVTLVEAGVVDQAVLDLALSKVGKEAYEAAPVSVVSAGLVEPLTATEADSEEQGEAFVQVADVQQSASMPANNARPLIGGFPRATGRHRPS